MALNATLRAKIEKPTSEELGLTAAAASLPNTFGNNWNDPAFRSTHAKKQTLRGEQTGATLKRMDLKAPPVMERPQPTTAGAQALLATLERDRDAVVAGRHTDGPSSDAGSMNGTQSGFQVDDKALRFFAYFHEQIPESAVETLRTRKVSLTFFLSDETVIVQEPRVANSGLPGGTLLKRQRVPIADVDAARRTEQGPGHITINDLEVNNTIHVFGFRYHIYSCDGFTREFLTAIGADVPMDGPEPDDAYHSEYRSKRINAKAASKSFETKDLSATLESLASKGACAQHYPGETERTRRFVRDSGKVLSFVGLWHDEEAAPGGILRTLDVRYFVEDDTILIVEKPNPVTKSEMVQKTFLSRRRLPVSGKTTKSVELTFAGRINGQRDAFLGNNDRYVDATDLYIGAEINVFGRVVKLFNCDGYTREFMMTEMGLDPGSPVDVSDLFPKYEKKLMPVPPPTGFGDDDDSLASCSIQPKAKNKDMRGWHEHGGESLRFEMKLKTTEDNPEDALRRFLLTFYLADNEVMITEMAVRNTGFTGGRFLKKQKIEKTKGQRDFFKADDFYTGAEVTISGFKFVVTDLDEHSKKYREFASTKGRDPSTLKAVPPQRLKELLNAFREYVTVRFYTNTEAFRAFDRDHDGYISLNEMREVLKGSLITPHEEEAVALVKFFDKGNDGHVSYKDFMEAVAVAGAPATPKDAMDADATRAFATADQAQKKSQRTAILKALFQRLEGRCLNGFEMFRLLSTMPRAFRGRQTVELVALTNGSKDTLVTPVQLRRGLSEVLGMNLKPAEMAIVLDFFFPELPPSEYDAPADRSVRYGLKVADFQQKLTEMSRMGQL
jgi:hypothetical protein